MSTDFYWSEWHKAIEEGNYVYAADCKEKYRELVMENRKAPYKLYIEKLKAYPPIYLN